jgi:Tfp pilus assembly protein PilF
MPWHYDSVLTANPNNAEAHFKYACYLTNKVYKNNIDSNDIKAKKQYVLALKINPQYAEASEEYASFLWKNFKDTVSAKRYFKRLWIWLRIFLHTG